MPDGDKLGFVVASFFATLVLAINVFFLSVRAVEVAFRVALTFSVCWVATATVVHYMVSTTVMEMHAEMAARRRARQEAEEEEEMESEAGE